jgi:hypothetical protein
VLLSCVWDLLDIVPLDAPGAASCWGPLSKGLMMRRFAWASVPSPSFSVARINQIIIASRRNNLRHHISGMLLFTGAHFLAVLEGEDGDLNELWRRLERDHRHRDIFKIADDACEIRMYEQWKMGFTDDAKVDAQIDSLRSLQTRVDDDRAAIARDRSGWGRIIHPILCHADSM